MNDVGLDGSALQSHPIGSDGALDGAGDRDFLRLDAALDLSPLADPEFGGAQLTVDPADHLRRSTALDVADNRHGGADARYRSRCGLDAVLVDCFWHCGGFV